MPPYEPDDGHHGVSAAIEFAVLDLKVKDIVILGHACCGGITALCNECIYEIEGMQECNENKKEFINSWCDYFQFIDGSKMGFAGCSL